MESHEQELVTQEDEVKINGNPEKYSRQKAV